MSKTSPKTPDAARKLALLTAVSALGVSLGVTVQAQPANWGSPTVSNQIKGNAPASNQIKGESQQLKYESQQLKYESQQLKYESQQQKVNSQQLKIDSLQQKGYGGPGGY